MSESINQTIHDPILSIRDLKVVYEDNLFSFKNPRFSRPAIDGVSLDIPHRQTIGIVGESGCGKSTIAKSILMMTKPSNGEILFNGTSLETWRRNRLAYYAKVQMIWQDPFSSINPKMRIGEIISRPLHNFFHFSSEEIDLRLHATIKLAGLTEDHLVMYPHELSGGGRQRVTIARALISDKVEVVRDYNHRNPQLVAQTTKQVENRSLGGHIQRCGRFISNNQLGMQQHGHGDNNSLAHTTTELVWILM